VNGKREKLAHCLLACGASTDVKPPGEKTTVAGLARQYDTPTSRLVLAHHAASKRRAAAAATTATTKKRKRASSTAIDLATSVEGKDAAAAEPEQKAPEKKKKEKEKKEPAAEKLREKELEAEVRRLAKLDHYDDKTKLDVFTLRRMLRARGVLAGDMPTRKLALLELAVEWFGAGN
jgi:hypothetical protein